jgi:hypothetical protein
MNVNSPRNNVLWKHASHHIRQRPKFMVLTFLNSANFMWGSWTMFSGCLAPRYCSSPTNNKEKNLGNPRRIDAERMGKVWNNT